MGDASLVIGMILLAFLFSALFNVEIKVKKKKDKEKY